MPMPSANGIAMVDRDHTSSPSTRKTVDELRRQVSKLKAELEVERSKLKQVHRDKTNEIKRNHENYERERQKAIESVTKRLQNEHSVELRRVKDAITKEKDNELRQFVKFKDEESKALKQQTLEEKEKCKRLEDEHRKHFIERTKDDSTEIERRLRNEIDELKVQKRKAEENYKLKAAADFEKAELLRRLKAEHEREVNELIRQSKREVAKEFQQIRTVEKALEEKSHELAFKDQLTRKLEAEKQEIRQRKTSAEFNQSISESPVARGRSLSLTGTFNSTADISPEAVDSPGKGNKDKERELRKKNADLQSKLDRLEKKCTMLEKQNASRGSGSQKASGLGEEKIKKLKKRNSELVSIARQLEEKAKKLQEEKNVVMKQANSKANNSPEVEHMKKLFARQRAKDLAEHARIQMTRDSELDSLRKELGSGRNESQNEKIDELQSIIRKAAKERLLLEKKLASGESPSSSPLPSSRQGTPDLEQRLQVLEEEKRKLKTDATKLKSAEDEAVRLNKILVEKENECEKLQQEMEEKQVKCSKLELERERFAAKCTILHQKNSELGKKVKEMKRMEEEILLLKEDVDEIEKEKIAAEEECQKLREQVEKLLHFKQDFQASEQQRKELETKHMSSLDKLNEREEEIKQLHKIQEESTRVNRLAVTSLEKDVRNLEQKCTDTSDKYMKVTKDLENLRAKQTCNHLHKATQTSEARHSTPAMEQGEIIPTGRKSLLNAEPTSNTPPSRKSSSEGNQSNGDILDTAASRIKLLAGSDSEDDTISGYSDQPAAHRKPSTTSQHSEADENDDITSLSLRISQAALSDASTASATDEPYDSDASRDLNSVADGDMGDLEDNDLSQCVADREDSIGPRLARLKDPVHSDQDSSAPEDEQPETRAHVRNKAKRPGKVVNNKGSSHEVQSEEGYCSPTEGEHLAVYIARYSYDPTQHSPNDCPDAELAFQAGDYLYIYGDIDEDGFFIGELMNGQRGLVPSNFIEKVADEDEMAWMMNGTDETYNSSEEEEAERKLHRNLRLNVEHIPDANLGDIVEEEDGGSVTEESREVLLSQDGVTSDDTDLEPPRIPSPKRVLLERQFTRSVLLNWKAADLPADEVRGYGIYVNGDMRMMIKGSNRTKALIEDIDPDMTYRISVRTLTNKGDESQDQEAMLTIGKDASLAPSDLQVTAISPTSAKIEWLPGNSSYSHQIIVNGTPQRTIRPGTYQHTLVNLEPSEHYRVHVCTKKPQFSLDEDERDVDEDPLAAAVEFTTEDGGLPDPPLDVTLLPSSPGNAPNSLELTWIPVTISDSGTSNGARVTGYKVYINSIQCAEVTSATADGVTVVSWMIERAVKKNPTDMLQVYVKTQSLSGESISSNVINVSLSSFNFRANHLIETHSAGTPLHTKERNDGSNGLDSNGSDSGTEMEDRNHNVRESKGEMLGEKGALEVAITPEENEKPHAPETRDEHDGGSMAPDARTKGTPKVWQVDVEEDSDSGDSNKCEFGGSSDEDEAVEMCTTEPRTEDTNNGPQGVGERGDQHDEHPYEQLEEDIDETYIIPEADREATGNTEKPDEETRPTDMPRKMSSLSEASDIDMEELNRSLHLADCLRPDGGAEEAEGEGGKEAFIRPLEFTESDMEDTSEETPLSVIQEEEEEEVIESRGGVSRSSRTLSASDGFLSDDDILDLLDEEPEDNQTQGSAVSAANVRSHSQQGLQLGVGALVEDEDQPSLDRYLSSPTLEVQPSIIVSPGRSLEGIQFEEGSTESERNNAYSDVEADQGGANAPHRTSTPLDDQGPAVGVPEYHPPEIHLNGDQTRVVQGGDDDAVQGGDDVVRNRTYTLDGSEDAEEDQGELIRIFIALYDYDPSSMSPNPGAEEEELKFSEGDLIKIYGDKDEDGFYWGECDGVSGFVPYNMVSEVQVEDEDLLNRTASSIAQSHEPHYPQDESAYPLEQAQYSEESGQEQPRDTDTEETGTEEIHLEDPLPQDESIENYSNDQSIPQDESIENYSNDQSVPQDESIENYWNDQSVPQDESIESYSNDQSAEDIPFEDPRSSTNYSLSPRKMIALFDYDPRLLSPNPDSEIELSFRVGDIIYVYGEMDEDGFYTGELLGVRGLVPSNFLEELVETVPSPPSFGFGFASQDSSAGPSKEATPNGTHHTPEKDKETPKKKKGILSKGKQMFKKMTKGQTNKK